MRWRRSLARLLSFALAMLIAVSLPAAAAPLREKSAHAKTRQEKSQPQSAPQNAGPPPYEPDLLRLSQIIGALAYLRNLCGAHDGDRWRTKMSALLTAEGGSETVREQLAGAYNKGFRDYELIYRTCTPNARLVISRYLAAGSKLTRKVTAHYGG